MLRGLRSSAAGDDLEDSVSGLRGMTSSPAGEEPDPDQSVDETSPEPSKDSQS